MLEVMNAAGKRAEAVLLTMSPEVIKERIATMKSSPAALLEFQQTLLAFDFMISEANDKFTIDASRNNYMAIQIILATDAMTKLLERT